MTRSDTHDWLVAFGKTDLKLIKISDIFRELLFLTFIVIMKHCPKVSSVGEMLSIGCGQVDD
jgi:hypothetical protein